MSALRFIARERTEFASVLRKRVRAYFADNDLSQKDNGVVATKGVVLLSLYVLPFLALLIFQPASAWGWVSLALAQGVGIAGVGMCLMHDSLHGALSPKQKVNDIWGMSMYLLGGSVFGWKMQHNRAHHTYTNILGHDEDIRERPYLRFSPSAPWHPAHRFQHIYGLFLYPFMTLTMFTKDFTSLKEYDEAGLLAEAKTTYRHELWVLIASKALFITIFVGAPVLLGALNIWQSALYFLLAQMVAGFVMSVIFQLAHVVEEAAHPEPNAGGNIENEWMIHQLETTVNFCPRNPVLNWYTGGLNFQVEHHLFPNICHVHYPALSKIVKATAEEFGISYMQIDSFGKIFGSHMRHLRRLGRGDDLRELAAVPVPAAAPREVVEA